MMSFVIPAYNVPLVLFDITTFSTSVEMTVNVLFQMTVNVLLQMSVYMLLSNDKLYASVELTAYIMMSFRTPDAVW